MTTIETLKQWFSNLKKPTQEQFWEWLDSFWHKSEKIPMANVEGLDKLVEGTASAEQLSNHLNDSNAHKILLDKKVDKEDGKGLSTNDFTTTLKEKLEGISPFLGKFITGNLITGETEFFPNLETGMEEWGSFTFQLFDSMRVGEYILSYTGYPLGEGMFINLIDTSNS